MLNWTERMIRLRKECPEIGWGKYAILKTSSSNVLAIRYDWRNNSVLVLHNFSDKPTKIRLSCGVPDSDRLVNLIIG